VRVRLLGTGDPFGSGGRFQSAILLEGGGGPVLLDCGATTPVALARAGVRPSDLAAVVLSHLHGDHLGGLPFLLFGDALAARDGAPWPARAGTLLVAGPAATAERIDRALKSFAYPGLAELGRQQPITFVELPAGQPTPVGPCSVTAVPVDHEPVTSPTAL